MKKHRIMKKTAIALLSAMLLLSPQAVYAKAYESPYKTWKVESVQYPEKGQLVPAGPIQIEWEKMENEQVKKYEVYLDDILQDVTITNEGAKYSCEIYTTKVAKHQVRIVAILQDDTRVSTSLRNFYVSKKGLGFHSDGTGYSAIQDAQNMGLSWYYNWGTAPSYTGECPNNNIEFVPMIWSAYEGSNDKITEIKNAGYKTILGYNEPDLEDQANVPAEVAIENQHYFTESNLRVGSAVTGGTPITESEWFNEYWQGINTDDVDFITIHNYPGYVGETDDQIKNYAAQFLYLINNTYEKFNKPIWITEYGVANNDSNWDGYNGETVANKYQVKKFMEYTINGFGDIKGLNDLDFVERYAWFTFDALDRRGGDSGLFYTKADQTKKPQITVGSLVDLGTQYRNLGNPEGYVLAKLDGSELMSVADEYVKDTVKVTVDGKVQEVEWGNTLDVPSTPTKAGYVFKGWYADSKYTKAFDFKQAITKDTKVYAKYVKTYKVTINGKTYTVERGKKVAKPKSPTKAGYIFKGWYADSKYTKVFNFNQAIIKDTKVYAKFVKTYKVTINGKTYTVEKGKKVAKPKSPTKKGYVFKGWYADSKYKKVFNFNQAIIKDTKVYAKFVKKK